MKKLLHKHRKNQSFLALFSFLAACNLTICTPAETAETVKTEETSFDRAHLRETLKQLRTYYRKDFTFAMKLPENLVLPAETETDTSPEENTVNPEENFSQDTPENSRDYSLEISSEVVEIEPASEVSLEIPEFFSEFSVETSSENFSEAIETVSTSVSAPSSENTSENTTEKNSEQSPELSLETDSETSSEPSDKTLYEHTETEQQEAPIILYTLKDYYELRDYPLPALPKTIEVLETRLTKLTESYSGTWSVYVKNLKTLDELIINDTPMKSASVMKLFIMGTVYDAMENQELERTAELVDLLNNMISYSSNEASNRLLSLLGSGSYADGIAKVNQYIADHGFSDQTHEYNGFEDPSTYTDPDHFNQVCAKDCGKILEQIYHRTFGSRSVCNEIETMMLNQNTRYKIPRGLPEGIQAGNKTGEMDTAENDVAIVYGEKSDYILCILSNDWNSKDEAITHISEISSIVYDFFDDESYYQNNVLTENLQEISYDIADESEEAHRNTAE